MKKAGPRSNRYLDICCLHYEMSLSNRKRTFYFMTLLAYASIHGRKDMVQELIKSGARKSTFNYNCTAIILIFTL